MTSGRTIARLVLSAALAAALLASASAVSVQAAPAGDNVEAAESGVAAIYCTRLCGEDGLHAARQSCRRAKQPRRFRCWFRVVKYDEAWEGRGQLRLRRDGLFAYDLRGFHQTCGGGNGSCRDSRPLRWRGVTPWG